MAKNDNLTDFLTDVADAIREKTGDAALINPQDFSQKILDIETGGGGSAEVETNDVNFYDYDGTCLHSYSAADFLTLTELPPLPTREGLVCQEWNWSYEDAISQVQEMGVCNVGATYITDDGKTRLYLTIEDNLSLDTTFTFGQTIASGVIVNWGDGSAEETFATTGGVTATHRYERPGEYIVTLNPSDDCNLSFSGGSSSCMMGSNGIQYRSNCYKLRRFLGGKNIVSIGNYGFSYCSRLEAITIPKGLETFLGSVFQAAYQLRGVVFPSGIDLIGNQVFYWAYKVNTCCLPKSLTSIGDSSFSGIPIRNLVFHKGITSLGSSVVQTTYFTSFVLPPTITRLNTAMFKYCYGLSSIFIPSSITYIAGEVFYNCGGLKLIDFSTHESIPSLYSSNVFSGINSSAKIVVSDDLYDSWIAATNWSKVASYIISKSDWDASQA